jgi:hypothetical protein
MIRAVLATSLREMGRRWTALLLILLLPLAFYLVRIDVVWQAIRFLSIGVGWAIATLALFTFIAARDLDRRLAVVGASPSALFIGRLLAVLTVGLVLSVVYFGVVALTQDNIPHTWAVLLLLIVSALVGAPVGALLSLVISRELDGALALLVVMAVQLLVDPEKSYTRLMPWWSTRELSGYAIGAPSANSLPQGLLHFGVTVTVCALAAWIFSILRLRVAPTGWDGTSGCRSVSEGRARR